MDFVETVREYVGKAIYKVFGNPSTKILKRLAPNIDVIAAWEPIVEKYSDRQLKYQTFLFRKELTALREKNPNADEDGTVEEYLTSIMPKAFALCREAAKRTLGMRHYDVQLIGGMVLHSGMIAEMITGEGKTLVATLASYLNALARRGKYVSWKKIQQEMETLSVENPVKFHQRMKEQGLFPDRLAASHQFIPPSSSQESSSQTHAADESPEEPDPLVFVGDEPSVVHVVTVNDYLAQRDANWNRPLFNLLGITVGCIQAGMRSDERHHEYKCDITYGTNSEFGFDYLRDNMKMTPEDQVQKRRRFSIIDEVDSILIDEARTPLIISGGPDRAVTDKYFIAAELADHLKPVPEEEVEKKMELALQGNHNYEPEKGHYIVDEKDHNVTLTARGIEEVERFLIKKGVLKKGENYFHPKHMDWPHFIDNALKAKELYKKEDEYVVAEDRDGRMGVIIVDDFTGRKMYGRRWSDGLHQAVEAKEIRRGEPIQLEGETQTLATITLQNFFLLYDKISGMTGTAATESAEFGKVYKLEVVVIPTNRPMRRINHPDLIYGTVKEKYAAIIDEIKFVHQIGRPILVGTTSVEKSEFLAGLLDRNGLRGEFNVLNAKQHEREAHIVEKAGELGAITVATNMAGRGTDIKLGSFKPERLVEYWKKSGFAPKNLDLSWGQEAVERALVLHWAGMILRDDKGNPLPKSDLKSKDPAILYNLVSKEFKEMGLTMPSVCGSVAELGGLHIIGTERHEARRIDNQLRGRSGRQGDPGSSRFFLSLDDDLMRLFAKDWVKSFLRKSGLSGGQALKSKMVSNSIEKAQRRVEEQNFAVRRRLLEYDDVMNKQRKWIYNLRQKILEARDLREITQDFLAQICKAAVERYYEQGFPDIGEITAFVDEKLNRYAPLSDLEDDLAIPGENEDDTTQLKSQSGDGNLKRETTPPPIQYAEFIRAVNRRFELTLPLSRFDGMDREELRDTVIETVVNYYMDKDEDLFKATNLSDWAKEKFAIEIPPEELKKPSPQEIYDALMAKIMEKYETREKELGETILRNPDTGEEIERTPRMRKLERYLLLEIIDKKWKDHLMNMDILKSGIYLRSYAQKDPKEEYKKEGGIVFEEMLDSLGEEFSDLIFKVELTEEVEEQQMDSVWQEEEQQAMHEEAGSIFEGRDAQTQAAETGGSVITPVQTIQNAELPPIRPNEKCPCGSGKKYKKCHGRAGSPPLPPAQLRRWLEERKSHAKMGG